MAGWTWLRVASYCSGLPLACTPDKWMPALHPLPWTRSTPCRFSATDSRCEMELDEVDPGRWAALEAATEEYIGLAPTQGQFAAAAAALVEGLS